MTTTDLPVRIATAPRRGAGALGTALNTTARLSPRLAGRLALELWRRPGGPARVREEERAVHDAARVGIVRHAGTEVTTYAWGDGARPVLLVHGWGARASRFAGVVSALLAAGHSPVSYDAWGHGATPGPVPVRPILEHQVVIAELARRQGPFAGAVAHSLGVPVALYAARSGLLAGRVASLSGVADFGCIVDAFRDRLGLDARVGVELRRAIERAWFGRETPGMWARFSPRAVPGTDVLVFHDAGDRVIDRGQADVLVAALGRGTRLVETTGLGHGRILRDPGVIAEVVAFLDGAGT